MKKKTALEWTRETEGGDDRRESRFIDPHELCPHPENWTSHDLYSTEDQVHELLHGLVRGIQPEYVIETGTHLGLAAEWIGRALALNGHGHLDTLEIEEELVVVAEERLGYWNSQMPSMPKPPVEVHHVNSLEFTPRHPIDFIWLDSGEGYLRHDEFQYFKRWFHERTIVAMHDTKPGTQMYVSCETLRAGGELRPVYFPTPRGLMVGQYTGKVE